MDTCLIIHHPKSGGGSFAHVPSEGHDGYSVYRGTNLIGMNLGSAAKEVSLSKSLVAIDRHLSGTFRYFTKSCN